MKFYIIPDVSTVKITSDVKSLILQSIVNPFLIHLSIPANKHMRPCVELLPFLIGQGLAELALCYYSSFLLDFLPTRLYHDLEGLRISPQALHIS